MNRITTHTLRARARGFSLLEVLLAVVLLATGLLALAALQGSLARNSADAKIRSRIVALLEADLDTQRSTAYANVASLGVPITANNPDCSDLTVLNDVEVAACEAGLGNLTLTRTVTQYGGLANGSAFGLGAPVAPARAQFKQIVVTAQWTDAQGQARSANMSTSLSALALDVNNPLVDSNSGNNPPKAPVVRQADPTTAGMIPVALGNGDSTAASNPTPEILGKNSGVITGTRFSVLTYTPEQNNLAIIQQRIETEVIKCTCQYGAGGTNLGEIYRTAQWPAVWTGKRYDVYVPDTATAAPGQQYSSGPKAGVTQSPLCQECCRDHHDNNGDTTNARFDPEASPQTYQKYDINGSGQLVVTGNTSNATYVDACRILRVDGMWRTAADMYSRQYGLLETKYGHTTAHTTDRIAGTGVPSDSATQNYTTFVKDYLKQYDGSVATAPTGAQAMYDTPARNLNLPAEIAIPTPTEDDPRFLHARGLYVDYLEKQARETLAKSLADRRAKGECAAGSSSLPDCVLPFLPFTTVNLTEITTWGRTNANIAVNGTANLGNKTDEPSGGRTTGKVVGLADATSTIRLSNSGVAASTVVTGAVDLHGDGTTVSDNQTFNVGGSNSSTGDSFYVQVNGAPPDFVLENLFGATQNPCTGNGALRECTSPSTNRLPSAGKLVVSKYGTTQMVSTPVSSVPGFVCKDTNGTTRTVVETTVDVPTYINYYVSGVTDGGTPDPATFEGTTKEYTTIQFSSIAIHDANNPIVVTFGQTGTPLRGTFVSCTADKVKGSWHIVQSSVVWTTSWQ